MERDTASTGIGLLTFAPAELAEFVELGRDAEALGYDRIYTTESLTDTFAIDGAIAAATQRITVGSFVALSYLRHPVIAAQAATTIQELSGGRFVLGLGLGHRVRNEAMGIEVGRPTEDLAGYVEAVRAVLEGRGRAHYPQLPAQIYQGRELDFRTPSIPVPLLTAAVGPRMAEVGGRVADGLMCYMQPLEGVRELRDAAERGARAADRDPAAVELHLGIHAFVADDEERALDRAREALAYWVGLPAYNQRLASAGFADEAAQLREAFVAGDLVGLAAGISDELLRQFCLVGTAEDCRRQRDAFVAAGADAVVVVPDPISDDETYPAAVRRTAEALQP